MDIELSDYQDLMLSQNEAYSKAAELLGIDEDEVAEYIERNHQWRRNDMEYQYMGYDCSDCYMGGDLKKGIIRGNYLILYATSPNYRRLSIWIKKRPGTI